MSAAIEMLVRSPFSEALGWALFHSVWQGALAAVLVAGVLTLVRSSNVRYWAGCLSLAAMLCAFTATFLVHLPELGPGGAAAGPILEAGGPRVGGAPAARDAGWGERLAWLAPLWMLGVCGFQFRGAAGWMAARRMRARGVCAAAEPWPKRLEELAVKMRVSRPVQLLESALAEVPVVIGHLRPVILAPSGFLTSLPPQQVEWILLHELAHIRRNDYLVNLLQTVTEAALFYHPAAWWISGVIRDEREHCCDDLAVAAGSGGGAHSYALALTALEERRREGGGRREFAAGVAATGGRLMNRIERLLYPRRPAAGRAWSALLPAVLAAAMAWQSAGAPQDRKQNEGPYMKWLNEDVAYLAAAPERATFLGLRTDEERERFIEQFWLRRDPTPGTAENERKEEHYRRIGYANQRFGAKGKHGWTTDRGRIYIVYGPPDEIESHPSGRAGGPPFEQWLYREIQGIGKRVIVDFVDKNRDGDFRQTTDPANKN